MESLRNKIIGVLMGGLSAEREVSLASGNAAFEAIKEKGFNAVAIDVDHKVAQLYMEVTAKTERYKAC